MLLGQQNPRALWAGLRGGGEASLGDDPKTRPQKEQGQAAGSEEGPSTLGKSSPPNLSPLHPRSHPTLVLSLTVCAEKRAHPRLSLIPGDRNPRPGSDTAAGWPGVSHWPSL